VLTYARYSEALAELLVQHPCGAEVFLVSQDTTRPDYRASGFRDDIRMSLHEDSRPRPRGIAAPYPAGRPLGQGNLRNSESELRWRGPNSRASDRLTFFLRKSMAPVLLYGLVNATRDLWKT